ncbi:MAG: hypothetical protein KAV82_00655 [Phycisphaerae bacterium]|nr:hypothetical protein [Phycisphaerae bacterium]
MKNGKWGDGKRDELRIENVDARNGAGVFSGDKSVAFSGDPEGSAERGELRMDAGRVPPATLCHKGG